jgi:hypothetical protein
MKFLIIIPTMVEYVMDNCFKTIDPKYHKNLLLIDNSKEGYAQKYGVDYEHYPENIGIPRSWNIGAKKVIDENLDYLIVMSSTMIFNEGMRDFVQYMEMNTNKWGLETQHIWHLIALRRAMFERVGLFDENFFCYYEDSDYIRRWELNGIHNPMSLTQRLPKVEVAATTQGTATALKSGLKIDMGVSRQTFIDKWGYEPLYDSQENRDRMYIYPYNNPLNNIDYCKPTDLSEVKKKHGLI